MTCRCCGGRGDLPVFDRAGRRKAWRRCGQCHGFGLDDYSGDPIPRAQEDHR